MSVSERRTGKPELGGPSRLFFVPRGKANKPQNIFRESSAHKTFPEMIFNGGPDLSAEALVNTPESQEYIIQKTHILDEDSVGAVILVCILTSLLR